MAEAKKIDKKKANRSAKGKKRQMRAVPIAKAYVQASVNNTIVTITDLNGNTLVWASSGNCGFRGPKKATPYAASIVVEKVVELMEPYAVKELHVISSGIGGGRDSAVRTFNSKGLTVLSIKEITPVPHNGCRPRKPRRV